ncbi:MAG: beta-glucosidase [Limnochordaceae bacterium]|nr:beta-glucosidase [Limnochordaceae bacterium]
MAALEFPRGFRWGTATASYQVEGAVSEDGRGESIWDRFSHTPGKTANGDTGDIACDEYHRYPEDIEHMKRLGVSSYRFSIAWPRIFPTGRGQPNLKGLDYYRRLVDALRAVAIEPVATLYHWDLPQALQEKGGWANRDTAHWFAEYADYVMRKLSGPVSLWITQNEPWVVAFLGHFYGEHAPGLRDPRAAFAVAHHLLLSHGLAVEAFREEHLAGRIGITLNIQLVHPASASPADQAASRLADGALNRWFLDPIFRGCYPEDVVALVQSQGWMPNIGSGDMATIQRPIDFLGVNYYTRTLIAADPSQPLGVRPLPGPGAKTQMGWEVYPEGLYEVLTRLYKEYQPQLKQLYITENGAAYDDHLPVPVELVNDDTTVHDPERVEYLGRHFYQAWRAIQDGVPLAGYFVWALLDNFEWALGYTRRFGLLYVDYPTQRRVWKQSAHFYQKVIAANAIDSSYGEERPASDRKP